MLRLTRINHQPVTVHCSLIEHIDTTPDTVISLTTGERMTVIEQAEEVIALVVEHHRSHFDWSRLVPVRRVFEEN